MDRNRKSQLMSAIFMGAGQIYNKSYGKGVFLGLINLLALIGIPMILGTLWGLVTLGDQAQLIDGFDVIQGDHSIYLMIEGFGMLVLLLCYLGLYIHNIKDARDKSVLYQVKGAPVKKKFKDFLEENFKFVMLFPGAFGLLFFIILPIIITIAIAFTNYSAPDHIPPRNLVDWVGLKSFAEVLSMKIWQKTMLRITIWNIIWAVLATFTTYSMGLLLAILTSRKGLVFQKFWRGIFILPYAIPAFVSLLVFRLLLNGVGPVNSMLLDMGLEKMPFLTDPLWARSIVILVNMWVGAPYFMILLSGTLTNISASLYEAADIDGANKFEQFRFITLPMILFQTAPVLIMQFAFNFNNFGAVYLLTEGKPLNSALRYAGDTDILVSWLYKLTLNQNQYNMAAVISIFLFIFISIFSLYNFSRSSSFKNEGMM